MIAKAKRFVQEVRVELAKASWPWDPKEKGFKKYRELTDSTTVVIIGMILMGAYVAFFDLALIGIVSFLTTGATH